MNRNALEKAIRSHRFARDLDESMAHSLAACASKRQFQAGDYLWRQGESADVFYLIQSGQVALQIQVPHQGALRLETIHEGEVVGWSWCIPPYRWHFDAKTLSAVQVIALDARCIRQKCEQDHEMGYQLLKRILPILQERLQVTRLRLIDLCATASV